MVSQENLRITITRHDDSIVVKLDGDLDVYVGDEARGHLDDAIDRAVAHSLGRLVLDAGGLTFCDSTGLSILINAQFAADKRGIHMSLRGLSPSMRDLLRLTDLDAILDSGDE